MHECIYLVLYRYEYLYWYGGTVPVGITSTSTVLARVTSKVLHQYTVLRTEYLVYTGTWYGTSECQVHYSYQYGAMDRVSMRL